MNGSKAVAVLGIAAFFIVATRSARASFHEMQIEKVIGGVNGDTSAQAIELRMRSPGQNFLHSDNGGTFGPAGLVARDANGLNPVNLITFPNDVANGLTGDTVLISSSQFSHDVSPAFDATNQGTDFTFTNLIPASYLAAGRIDYVDGPGDVLWSLSYGGANYKGPTAAANFNGTFGGPYAGTLPSSGLQDLEFLGAATAASTTNATDYALSAAAANLTNNARNSFQATPEPGLGAVFALFATTLFSRRRRVV